MKDWPKLSETLRFERHPEACQNCGEGVATGVDNLQTWMEHDEDDKPSGVVVILCPKCAGRLIEPHPRLYDQRPTFEPRPGAMPICADCKHRKELKCLHPALKANGGAGLNIKVPEPSRGFWDGRDKTGKRTGGMFVHYPHWPRECAGRET